MKTNLSKAFGTNKELELEGKWFEIAEDISFRMRRTGGANSHRFNELRALYFKPYARQIKTDSLNNKTYDSLFVQVFVDACMVDWKGLLDEDDNQIPYSKEVAIKLFTEHSDLFDTVVELTGSMDEFKEGLEEMGNS